jgi:Fur family ferric uptake transcriptional regulator
MTPSRADADAFEPSGLAAQATSGDDLRERLREAGFRLTPQRRLVLQAVVELGHSTPEEITARVQATADGVNVSTVYRTLDVLEELGLVRHGHGPDGREEYHVLPDAEHGHLHCRACGAAWEITRDEGATIVATLEAARGFAVDLSHVTIVGRCRSCR